MGASQPHRQRRSPAPGSQNKLCGLKFGFGPPATLINGVECDDEDGDDDDGGGGDDEDLDPSLVEFFPSPLASTQKQG